MLVYYVNCMKYYVNEPSIIHLIQRQLDDKYNVLEFGDCSSFYGINVNYHSKFDYPVGPENTRYQKCRCFNVADLKWQK